MSVLYIAAGIWLAIGTWLSLDGLKQAMPRIRAQRDPLPAMLVGVAFAFIAGVFWLPVPFFRALVRGGR